jgi:hypothetical protein
MCVIKCNNVICFQYFCDIEQSRSANRLLLAACLTRKIHSLIEIVAEWPCRFAVRLIPLSAGQKVIHVYENASNSFHVKCMHVFNINSIVTCRQTRF